MPNNVRMESGIQSERGGEVRKESDVREVVGHSRGGESDPEEGEYTGLAMEKRGSRRMAA